LFIFVRLTQWGGCYILLSEYFLAEDGEGQKCQTDDIKGRGGINQSQARTD